ncbi:hypothetical protein D3C78_1670690 [compost metagenome]
MVERADHAVAFQGALRQVRAHVRAVGVEEVDLAAVFGERHQAGAEDVQGVQLAVAVVVGDTQAVPAARETVRQRIVAVVIGHQAFSVGHTQDGTPSGRASRRDGRRRPSIFTDGRRALIIRLD